MARARERWCRERRVTGHQNAFSTPPPAVAKPQAIAVSGRLHEPKEDTPCVVHQLLDVVAHVAVVQIQPKPCVTSRITREGR